MADYRLNLTTPPIKTEPEPLPPALPETATPSTFEVGSGSEGPLRSERLADSRLADDAEQSARQIAETARDKFHDVAEEARDRMNDVAHRASDMADQAGRRLSEIRDHLNRRLPIWKQRALDRVDDARFVARRAATEADQKARQYPMETIAAAAGAAFLIGATMRIWRSTRG